MKKFIGVLVMAVLFFSCESKEEKIIKAFHQENLKEISINVDDFEYNIESVEEVGKVTAKDSMVIVKRIMAESFAEDFSQEALDTLTFDYAIDFAKRKEEGWREISTKSQEYLLEGIEKGYSYSFKEKMKKSRNEASSRATDYQALKINARYYKDVYEIYGSLPERVLSTKIKATHSMINPLLGYKQTITRMYYTNKGGDKVVASEDL